MTPSESTTMGVTERTELQKFDCTGDRRQLIETIIVENGQIVARIVHDPPLPA
jgi:hypothetical protein